MVSGKSGGTAWVVDMIDVSSFPFVAHACRTLTVYFDAPVMHATIRRTPTTTPLSDLRDAGFDVFAYGVFPSEIDGCDVDGIGGEHVLLRPAEPITNDLGKD